MQVAQYQSGQTKLIGYFIGMMLRETGQRSGPLYN